MELTSHQPSPPELADVANREHALVGQAVGAMVEHAIRAGEALVAAKAQVNHGGWLPWLDANFNGSNRHAERYMMVAANSTRVADLDEGLSLRAVVKRLERINREEKADEARQLGIAPVTASDDVEIRHGDLRECLDDLAGQVDAIVTDPPYPAEYLDEFDALGVLASRLLKPTGLLIVMVGQTHLPAYLERLGAHLEYRWCGAYLTEGPATRIHGRKVGTKWKPLLIYGGETFITQDVFASEADDKEHHDWGQSESGMADIVERLTATGDLIVDPFLGGGTTAMVCRGLGRRFVGCDVDAAAVHSARERLA